MVRLVNSVQFFDTHTYLNSVRVRRSTALGIDLAKEFPSINEWVLRIDGRAAVQAGLKIPAAA